MTVKGMLSLMDEMDRTNKERIRQMQMDEDERLMVAAMDEHDSQHSFDEVDWFDAYEDWR